MAILSKSIIFCSLSLVPIITTSQLFCMASTARSTSSALQEQIVPTLKFISDTSNNTQLHLTATTKNNADTDVTILTWNSLLDPSVGLLGVVSIKNLDDGTMVAVPKYSFNRVRPPPESAYVTIDREGETNNTITISVSLKKGTRYQAQAAGNWMEVWVGDMHGASGAVRNVPYTAEPIKFVA